MVRARHRLVVVAGHAASRCTISSSRGASAAARAVELALGVGRMRGPSGRPAGGGSSVVREDARGRELDWTARSAGMRIGRPGKCSNMAQSLARAWPSFRLIEITTRQGIDDMT